MKSKKTNETVIVLLSCCFGIVSALMHWIVPTRVLLGNALEYTFAAVAAVLAVTAFFLFYLGFILPRVEQKKGLCGNSTFYMPALCWSTFGLLIGASATTAKLIRAILYGFVPVQTEGIQYGFAVMTLINVPVLICFAVLYLLEQKQQTE